MVEIFRSWLQSLAFLAPLNLFALAKDALRNLVSALWLTMRYFYWLLIADVVLFLCFGDLIIKAYRMLQDVPLKLGSSALFLILASSVVWSVLTVVLFLFLRKPAIATDIKQYIVDLFLRYMQLLFILSFIIIIGAFLLLGIGIKHFPHAHWSFKIFIKVFQTLMVFYWFDSSLSIKDVATSIEKAINLIIYKLPLLILFFIVIIAFDALLSSLFSELFSSCQLQHMFFADVRIEQILAVPEQKIWLVAALGLRYIKTLFEFFLIAFLYGLYTSQRDLVTTTSFFDAND